ncbi:MAG: EamA family transporter [Desulfobulbus sp.]|nr:MAG: EamA family transporter [Desulfobulbus sp.]
MQEEKHKTVFADFLLLLVAAVWGFGFVAQRAGMDHLGPFAFNGIRFILGGICLLPFMRLSGQQKNRRMSLLLASVLAGLFLFAGASLQQIGIQFTTAGKAGFITGLYVIIVPIIGTMAGLKTNPGTWLGGLAAITGLYFLCIEERFIIAAGDLFVLVSALFWALHVLLLGYLSTRTHPIRLAAGQFFVCGLCSLIAAALGEQVSFAAIQAAIIPLLYGGLGSVGIGYTLQVVAQQKAHPSHAALLLSMESAFAALGGWWLLGEHLSSRGIIGCALMLAGMIISQVWPESVRSGTGSNDV